MKCHSGPDKRTERKHNELGTEVKIIPPAGELADHVALKCGKFSFFFTSLLFPRVKKDTSGLFHNEGYIST